MTTLQQKIKEYLDNVSYAMNDTDSKVIAKICLKDRKEWLQQKKGNHVNCGCVYEDCLDELLEELKNE